jgi:multimeric flavodoxin WrbA
MSKKILIIKGSGRKNGYTNRICDEIVDFLKDEEAVIFDTYAENFSACNGCNFCETNGRCINTDLDAFYKSFEECDEIIFLSPVYNGSFPGPLKSLIDRFQVYYTTFYHNNKIQPIKKRRRAWFVASSGRAGTESFAYMQSQLKCAFTILNVEMVESFLCPYTDTCADYLSVVDNIKRSLSNDQR